jgi:hypothetical protein
LRTRHPRRQCSHVALQQFNVRDVQLAEVLSGQLQHGRRVVYGKHPPHPGGYPGDDEARAGADVGDLRVLVCAGDIGHLLYDALVVVGA